MLKLRQKPFKMKPVGPRSRPTNSNGSTWSELVRTFLENLRRIREERTAGGQTVGGGELNATHHLRDTGAMMDSQYIDARGLLGILGFASSQRSKVIANDNRWPFVQFTVDEIQRAWRDALAKWRGKAATKP